MQQIYDGNFYAVRISYAAEGDTYEYRVFNQDGSHHGLQPLRRAALFHRFFPPFLRTESPDIFGIL